MLSQAQGSVTCPPRSAAQILLTEEYLGVSAIPRGMMHFTNSFSGKKLPFILIISLPGAVWGDFSKQSPFPGVPLPPPSPTGVGTEHVQPAAGGTGSGGSSARGLGHELIMAVCWGRPLTRAAAGEVAWQSAINHSVTRTSSN